MKKLFIIPLILLVVSCVSVKKRPLCDEPMYLKGDILLAKYTRFNQRMILYRMPSGNVIIHNVPMEAKTDSIPVCTRYDKFIYYKK